MNTAEKTIIFNNGGSGCLNFVLTFLVITALWFGLPTPWGVLEIDLFPPGIYLNR